MKSVEDVKGWVGHDLDSALPRGREEMKIGRGWSCDMIREGGGIGLNGLWMRGEGLICGGV